MKSRMRRYLIPFLSLIVLTNPVPPESIQVAFPNERLLTQSNLTYIVDRLTDANPVGGGDGSGLTGDLRYSITKAQSGDSLVFHVTGAINLSRDLPIITQNVSIQGTDGLSVRGGGSNVFTIGSGANVTLSNLTITGGKGNGGGVFNKGTLTINDVTIMGNTAGDPTNGGGTGAGIWNYINGILILNNTTVSDNAVLGNSSYNPSRGGGIANYGTLTLNNSTVSGNSALEGSGGGISNTLPTSTLILNSSTISNNSATGALGNGSGIDNQGMLKIRNTIIAGNLDDDLHGVLVSDGHNLIGNTAGDSGFRSDLGDLLNVDPLLGSLEDNDGQTWTHALQTGSPAIDAGDNSICPSSDQRGVLRPQDGNQDGMAACDIGAYEFDDVLSTVTVAPVPIDTLTPTLTSAPHLTDTPAPTSTPAPPQQPCSSAVILVLAGIFLMLVRLR